MRSALRTLSVVALLLFATVPAASAQVIEGRLQQVVKTDLVVPRMDGPPTLVFNLDKTKIRPASGTYVTKDRTTIEIRDGRIVALESPTSRTPTLKVASIDEVALRHADGRPVLWLKDSRGRGVALPDGTFRSSGGQVLVVKGGNVVAYDPGK